MKHFLRVYVFFDGVLCIVLLVKEIEEKFTH